MREMANARDADLLVIDTGDRVEGNGLYDSSEPKGVYLSDVLRQQHVDIMTAGNHELYKQNTSEAELLTTVPNFRSSYLASNINIVHPATHELVPLAPRFKKFTTVNRKTRIVAFGFLFDFTGNYKNTIVQPVEETIEEDWFQEAIRDEAVDLFLVSGHVPVRSREYIAIFRAIRAVNANVPIQFFGGHYHIRDYVRYDAAAAGLASGRFLETIGFLSIDNLPSDDTTTSLTARTPPKFNRRYIDNNRRSFYHHTGLDEASFHTKAGRQTSLLIDRSRSELRLDEIHGCAPDDLWMSRVKYPANNSIYTWLGEEVLPKSLRDDSRKGKPALSIVNTGAIRFDIFKGPFTQDSTFIVSPFTSGFRYVKDILFEQAEIIVEVLNKQPQVWITDEQNDRFTLLAPPEQTGHLQRMASHPEYLKNQADTWVQPGNRHSPSIVPGYTTLDDAGADGDDTIHLPIPFHRVPNCIRSLISSEKSPPPETVDLVYVDFIEPFVAWAAEHVGLDIDFTKDADVYMPSTTLTSLILNWIRENWKCTTDT